MSLNGKTSFIVMLQAEVQSDSEAKRAEIMQILGDTTKSANELLENVSLLQWGAQLGDIELANTLLQKGADVKYTSEDGRTALHYAAQYGQLDMVKHLLKAMKNNVVDIENKEATPLHYAVANNHLDIVRYLIDNAIESATILDNNERNLLYYINGDLPIMQYLIEKAHVDWSHADANGKYILHHCVNQGYVALVRYLVDEQHADLEAGDENGWRPLHIGAYRCCMPLIQHFVEQGCDVNAVTNKGYTPLMLAAGWRSYAPGINDMETADIKLCGDIVRYLVEHGARLDAVDSNGRTALHVVGYTGDLPMIQCLIELGADVNMADHKERTLLHTAADNGNDELLRLLIANGADANAQDKFKMSPLSKAVEAGHFYNVKYLIETQEVNTAIQAINGDKLLHLAARVDNVEMMQFLIKHASCERLLNDRGDNGQTCLHVAVYNCFMTTVRYLISVGANVNMTDNKGRTALHAAAFKGNKELLELLIANGADANAQDNFNKSPLSYAVETGNFDIVKYLIETQEVNTAIQTINGETLLHLAVRVDNVNVVQFLIENASCERLLNDRGDNGQTCLHVAVYNCFMTTVRYLITVGANVNMTDNKGRTALHAAAFKGNKELLELLITNGGDANAQDEFKMSPLSKAVEVGHFLIAKYLIETQKVNTAIQTISGETLLHLVARVDNVEMMQFVIEHASCERFLNNRKDNGQTCLHIAAFKGFTETLRYLLNIGADLNCADKKGNTPLHYAIQNDNLNVAHLLCKHNANTGMCYGRAGTAMEYAQRHGSQQMKDFLRSVAPQATATPLSWRSSKRFI